MIACMHVRCWSHSHRSLAMGACIHRQWLASPGHAIGFHCRATPQCVSACMHSRWLARSVAGNAGLVVGHSPRTSPTGDAFWPTASSSAIGRSCIHPWYGLGCPESSVRIVGGHQMGAPGERNQMSREAFWRFLARLPQSNGPPSGTLPPLPGVPPGARRIPHAGCSPNRFPKFPSQIFQNFADLSNLADF